MLMHCQNSEYFQTKYIHVMMAEEIYEVPGGVRYFDFQFLEKKMYFRSF